MGMIMIVDADRCTGCHLCEIVCAVVKEGDWDISRARISIIKRGDEDAYLPLVCRHCEEPLCATVCPVDATRKNPSGGVVFDKDRCVSCLACIATCPKGGRRLDSKKDKVLRCDLCDGDPVCVRFCPEGAIRFMDELQMQDNQKRMHARKLYRK